MAFLCATSSHRQHSYIAAEQPRCVSLCAEYKRTPPNHRGHRPPPMARKLLKKRHLVSCKTVLQKIDINQKIQGALQFWLVLARERLEPMKHHLADVSWRDILRGIRLEQFRGMRRQVSPCEFVLVLLVSAPSWVKDLLHFELTPPIQNVRWINRRRDERGFPRPYIQVTHKLTGDPALALATIGVRKELNRLRQSSANVGEMLLISSS